MFALAACSVQAVWEGQGSSSLKPMFYFLTASHFTSICQDLWGQRECMEISARRWYIQALSHPNIQLFLSQIIKSDNKTLVSISLSVTLQASVVMFPLRSGDVPAQAQSGAVAGGARVVPHTNTQELKLSDSSLKHGPRSWFRCERAWVNIQRLIRIFSFKQPSQALTRLTYDIGVCGETAWFISLQTASVLKRCIWQV